MLPELLAPAGSMESLKAALHFGADAVYGGMKQYGLRAFAGNFDVDALREAVTLTHQAGKRFYVTMNVFPFDDQLKGFVEAARQALAAGVDAAIVSDLGAIVTLREKVPALPIHVSTQANTVNTPAICHYRALGCQRVILAREVSLRRMAEMHAALGDTIELETFVHGAACMSYSGRCMLSTALTGRGANQGACAQPCRWQYAVVEQKRPGQYMPVCEDANGTYIFSAKDLNLMPLLPELCGAGIRSLKIEGRMKTGYYVAVVVGAYRRALDLLAKGESAYREALPVLMAELGSASHRLSDTGFAVDSPEVPGGAEGFHQSREYLALAVSDALPNEPARFILKNRFRAGDAVELMTPTGVQTFAASTFLRDKTGEMVDTLGIAGEVISLLTPYAIQCGDILRGEVRNHRT